MELFNFLTETAVSSLELPVSNLYITNGDIVQHVGPGNDMTEKCDPEEADTRIVLHVIHALNHGATNVLVRTVDSDVVVILINQFGRFVTIVNEC